MKTIEIGAQESAQALTEAFASALAEAVGGGWTAVGGDVKKDGVPMYFRFYTNSNNVYITVSNGVVSFNNSNCYALFSASKVGYKLWVVQSPAGTIAAGIGERTSSARYPYIIAQTTAGEYVGIQTKDSTSIIAVLYANDGSTHDENTPSALKNDLVCTTLVKLPDIWHGAFFKDLYSVCSCPYANSELVYTIDGKNYRFANAYGTTNTYAYIAIPET